MNARSNAAEFQAKEERAGGPCVERWNERERDREREERRDGGVGGVGVWVQCKHHSDSSQWVILAQALALQKAKAATVALLNCKSFRCL